MLGGGGKLHLFVGLGGGGKGGKCILSKKLRKKNNGRKKEF